MSKNPEKPHVSRRDQRPEEIIRPEQKYPVAPDDSSTIRGDDAERDHFKPRRTIPGPRAQYIVDKDYNG